MGIMRWAVVGTAAVLVLGTAGAASAGTAESSARPGRVDPAAVQAGLDLMARDGAQGVQVRVVDGKRTLLLRGGTAKAGSARPVPLDGRFRIGSVTKTIVATVVLQLVGEGRVGLDEPVSRYLPGLVDDRITVRMLLGHTSGLFNYTDALPLDNETFVKERFRHYRAGELVELATSRPLLFPPGERFSYSNTNYIVAGMLIEDVTGRSWEREVTQRVLRPLGMRDTRTGGTVLPGPHARGYLEVRGTLVDVTALDSSIGGAAGGMISTTADLDRFFSALLGGKLLRRAELAEMRETVSGYGLGIAQIPTPCGGVAWGHEGAIPGYVTVSLSGERTSVHLSISTGAVAEDGMDGLNDVLIAALCP
ncbi:serine hydrolase domain-containing protein [Actinokineospora guangxiensis]|uniref:Serine hydrolase domain-containing protein n=1 Tax=Actinokineospora guangxiensis TaxID=1490288 RepID=A0ABW0ESY5_9PSEU